jgi:hypothetical protein
MWVHVRLTLILLVGESRLGSPFSLFQSFLKLLNSRTAAPGKMTKNLNKDDALRHPAMTQR